jgi:hypothetical protein
VLICVGAFSLSNPRAVAGAGAQESTPARAQSSAGQAQDYEGMITDTRCGAKHSAAVGMSAGDCARVCVHSGEHFALVDGDKTYTLTGDEATLKRMAGERVKIVGTLTGATISVESVTGGKS